MRIREEIAGVPLRIFASPDGKYAPKDRGSDLDDVVFTNKVISFILYFKTLAYLIIS